MDLMDMAQPAGMPSMQDMMQATRPQMMPQAPSVGAGWDYGRQQGEHEAMIQKAAILAQLRAKMQSQQADEFTAAGPGRMDEIALKNKLARGALDTGDLALDAQRGKAENAVSGERVKAIQNALKEIEPYVNDWDKAKPEDKPYIRKMLKEHNVSFGNHKLADMSDKDLDGFMSSMRRAMENTPKNDLVREGYASKERVAQTGADAKISVADRNNAVRMRLKAMGLDSPVKYTKEKERLLNKLSKEGGLTDAEYNTLDLIRSDEDRAAQAKADLARPEIDITGGKVTSTKPTVRPTAPVDRSKFPAKGAKPDGLDVENRVLRQNGKEIPLKAISKDGTEVLGVDGQTYKVK